MQQCKPVFISLLILTCSGYLQAADKADPLDEMVVVGSRLDLQARQLGSALTVLTADTIANIDTPFVADVLRHVPGLAVSRTGPAGGLTQVRIRGSEANHVLVIIDGIEMNPPNGEYDFSNLTTANIERIEVLRGAQSGIYGSNATAGVINIVTRPANRSASAAVQLESGSLEFDRQAIGVNGGTPVMRGSLSLSHQRFGFNASENGSEVDLSEHYSGSAQGRWQITETTSTFINGLYNNRTFDIDSQPAGIAVDSPAYGDNKDVAYRVGVDMESFKQRWRNKLQYSRSTFSSGGVDDFGRFGDSGSREKLSLQSRLDFDTEGKLQQRATLLLENAKESYRNRVPFDPSQVPEQSRRLRCR